MCNPTTGSPTITLCQLRPNYHIVSDSPKNIDIKELRYTKFKVVAYRSDICLTVRIIMQPQLGAN